MAKATARVELHIDLPVSDVFEFIADYGNNTQWQEGVVSSRQLTAGTPGVGTEVAYERSLLGRTVKTTSTMVVFEKDARIRMHNRNALAEYQGGYDFHHAPSGTRLVYEGVLTTRVPGLGGALAKKFASQMQSDLQRLKRLLEQH